MRTVRRLLYGDILSAVAFTAVAFLALFFFIDFVEELEDLGRNGYELHEALLHSLLQMPGHLYELAPIAVLIGTIFSMARLAQSSEFTILRTSGLGPLRALGLLTVLGVMFGLLTFAVGDYVAPLAEQQAVLLKSQQGQGGGAGAWLKDRRVTAEGERSYSIHVGSASVDGDLRQVRIFEFDTDGRLVRRIGAERGQVIDGEGWRLENVRISRWHGDDGRDAPRLADLRQPELEWPNAIGRGVLAAAVLRPKDMSTVELWRYTGHLADNEQAGQRYEIQFWRKALYPLACLVMMALALPFAYLRARSGGVSLKVFGGIMLGISFVLLNNVAAHIGLLQNWTPWLVAAAPSLLYLALSLAAFHWLVRHR
ncbi:LPS export ABC transporter permease LptG [Caldimonas tepidiphila]|uniref:LPS export ABC transporter permease LptG n=1 Tax=Caldimonas tepidiphila TaxID=2315841 RepID=UPI000E5BB1FE|nr:LPS export ABC transporter permease LptG [Caldimonas tepidiphila]